MVDIRKDERRIALEAAAIEARGLRLLGDRSAPPDPELWHKQVEMPAQTLLEKDRQFNLRLERVNSALSWELADKRTVVQAALVEWVALLRQNLMASLHTRTAGLADDPSCRGDLLADGTFLRYFEAIGRGDQAARFDAIDALAEVGRHSACLGAAQSERLAQAMVDAYNLLSVRLLSRHQPDALIFVTGALAQPMLLFHDVEKYKGSSTPIARWLTAKRELLRLSAQSGRLPSAWHGLWLYDRRSGRMLGFKHNLLPYDENEVDLVRLFDSAAAADHLGDGRCSLIEMVLRGVSRAGYYCAAGTCAAQGSNGGVGGGPDGLGDLCTLGFGGGGDSRGGSGAAASLCGVGLTVAGGHQAADAVQCLSRQVVRPGTEGMTCLAEATGMCADPISRFVKTPQQQTYAGTRPGTFCQLASQKDTAAHAWKDYEKNAADVRNVYDIAMAGSQATIKEAVDAYAFARQLWDVAETKEARGEVPPGTAEAAHAVEQAAAEQMNEVIADEVAKQEQFAKERDDLLKEASELRDEEIANGDSGGGSKRCADDQSCGDSCSAMSQAMLRTMQCVSDALNPPQIDPYGHGGCDPRFCDPMEVPNDAGARMCMGSIDDISTAAVGKLCWAVRCANGSQASVNASGRCGCNPEATFGTPGGLPNPCEVALCAGDDGVGRSVGTTFGGGCSCTSVRTPEERKLWRRTTDFGGLLPLGPKPLPTLGMPRPITEVNPLLAWP